MLQVYRGGGPLAAPLSSSLIFPSESRPPPAGGEIPFADAGPEGSPDLILSGAGNPGSAGVHAFLVPFSPRQDRRRTFPFLRDSPFVDADVSDCPDLALSRAKRTFHHPANPNPSPQPPVLYLPRPDRLLSSRRPPRLQGSEAALRQFHALRCCLQLVCFPRGRTRRSTLPASSLASWGTSRQP